MLSEAKHLILGNGTLRCAQGDGRPKVLEKAIRHLISYFFIAVAYRSMIIFQLTTFHQAVT